jgi:hypothetical protein
VTVTNLIGGPQTHTIDLHTPAVIQDTWNIELDDPARITFSGTLTDPFPGEPADQLVVSSYAFDPMAYDHEPPYAPLATTTVDLHPGANGAWSAGVDVPPEANLLQYSVLIHGVSQGWTRVVRLDGDSPRAYVFDIDLTAPSIEVGGGVGVRDAVDTGLPCATQTFMFDYDFIGFPTQPGPDAVGSLRDLPGAVILDKLIVLPDPVTHGFDVRLPVPGDLTYAYAERHFNDDAGDFYDVPNAFNTSTWIGFVVNDAYDPDDLYGSVYGTFPFEEIDCPPPSDPDDGG